METLTFTTVGTLGDFVTAKQDLLHDPINIADEKKQIYVKFMVDGKLKTAICSWPITNLLRTKQIALGNLFDYPMSESSSGVYSIHNEQRNLVATKREKLTIKELVKVEVSMDDLILL
jgi:hypothetical protein